jgi:S-DNA-T family DNA segregation ATPase FtsK/SpoIIIE
MQTIAVASAAQLRPSDLHIYVLDFAGGLSALSALPHCASMISRHEPAAAGRLLERLRARYADQSLAADTHPAHALLLIDGFENFATSTAGRDGGDSLDTLAALVRDTSARGLTVAISGDRTCLTSRLTNGIGAKYLLALTDRCDYALAGLSPRAVPATMPPGRAIRVSDGLMVQFATVADTTRPVIDQAALDRRIEQLCRSSNSRDLDDPQPPPIVVRPLPSRVRLHDLAPASHPNEVLLGVGGDAATPITVDVFSHDRQWLIAGPPRSGRSTLLIAVLHQLHAHGAVVVAALPQSRLFEAAARLGIDVLTPRADPNKAQEWTGSLHGASGPRMLLVDDCEAFLETPAGAVLVALAQQAGPSSPAIMAATRSDDVLLGHRGLVAELRRGRVGVLLQPSSSSGELLGLRLPRYPASPVPGRGLLVAHQRQLPETDGTGTVPLQVALP